MDMPMGRAALKLVMREMIARNRVTNGLLYIQVSRGHGESATIPFPMRRPGPL